jgi:integrase
VTERITERTIRKLRLSAPTPGPNGESRNLVVWDAEPKGFGVRITSAGAVAFVLRYVLDGRERRLTIGAHPDLSPSAAREEAVKLRGRIAGGDDPLANREDRRRAPTADQLCDRYIADHVERHNKPSTAATFKYLVEAHIRPALGRLRAQAVSRDDVAKLHSSMASTPRQANQTLAVLSKMMRCAEAWGLRPDGSNPCRLVRRYAENKRERFLTDDELKRLGVVLRDQEGSGRILAGVANAVRLLVLTGCRRGEILGLRWTDVDIAGQCLMIRDAKSGGRRQTIGAVAGALLESMDRSSDWVVWSVDPLEPLSVNTLESSWRRVRDAAQLQDVRLHDLRHTVGTYAGATGANAFVIRDVLGHKTLAMTGRYVSRDVDPLRAVTDAVSARIGAALNHPGAPAEVVSIAQRKTG